MVDTRAQLLSAILAAPDDDTPRLVYADWLEENGESERAEFIRAQIKLERHKWGRNVIEKDYDERDGISAEWQEAFDLYSIMEQLWYSPAKGFAPPLDSEHVSYTLGEYIEGSMKVQCRVSRGFIDSISAPLAALLAHGPAIVAENPVTEVRVTDNVALFVLDELIPDRTKWTATIGEYSGQGASRSEAVMNLSAAVLRVLRERAKQ